MPLHKPQNTLQNLKIGVGFDPEVTKVMATKVFWLVLDPVDPVDPSAFGSRSFSQEPEQHDPKTGALEIVGSQFQQPLGSKKKKTKKKRGRRERSHGVGVTSGR